MAVTHDKIAVVDFGGQYAHLIATKVRQAGVLAEIRQPEDTLEAFSGYKGIILSGSPSLSSFGEDAGWTKEIFDLEIPILGFCFGHQEIAKHYGGTVTHGGREWGHAALHLTRPHALFEGLTSPQQVWMSHFDSVVSLGPDFEELGYSVSVGAKHPHAMAAIGSDKLKRYGFQFHPEVDDTTHGETMIANFVLGICQCEATWNMDRYLDHALAQVRAQVGERSVFLLASGGVDSTVAAKLFALALPEGRLKLLHVDNGLMRKNESVKVIQMLKELGLEETLHFVDASEDFLEALTDLVEPEAKRRAIGDTFVAVFEREAQRLGISDHLLGQGTIYPDTVETGGTRRAHVIKTHHNRVPVIEQMIADGLVVEPLADLYKVEVRALAEQLGVPHEMAWRHPFPGPGLGVRLLCANGDEQAPQVAEQLSQIAQPLGLKAIALPVRSVGVKADLRCYEHPAMFYGETDWDNLLKGAAQVLQHVPDINRCLWSLSPHVPQRLHSPQATTSRERLDLLREADNLVMQGLRRHGIYDTIWQCPTALVPLSIDNRGSELVVIRPVHSARAMTARPAQLPAELIAELSASISALEGVSGVAIDLTSKPPGTIEWE